MPTIQLKLFYDEDNGASSHRLAVLQILITLDSVWVPTIIADRLFDLLWNCRFYTVQLFTINFM